MHFESQMAGVHLFSVYSGTSCEETDFLLSLSRRVYFSRKAIARKVYAIYSLESAALYVRKKNDTSINDYSDSLTTLLNTLLHYTSSYKNRCSRNLNSPHKL